MACWHCASSTSATTLKASSFVDYLSNLKRQRIRKKLAKLPKAS